MGRGQVQDSQIGTSSQAGQTICYFCQQLGHMRRDCPRRQRSHGTTGVDPTKTCTQAKDTATKGLLINPQQRYHKTC